MLLTCADSLSAVRLLSFTSVESRKFPEKSNTVVDLSEVEHRGEPEGIGGFATPFLGPLLPPKQNKKIN